MFHVKQSAIVEDWQLGGFGLYIHWPFCSSKCPYCDFNSHVSANIEQSRWQAAYLTEIDRLGEETRGRVLQTIFFGGGTPSLMAPSLVNAILEHARKTWTFANDIEITMEANPSSVEAGRFSDYNNAGVNRVSIGVQALNDADLKALGRLHSVAEAKAAIKVAQNTFERVSFDLIYARQQQSLTAWKGELAEALAIASGHLSLYQLTIEDGTAFGDRFHRGLLRGLPDEDLGAEMYIATQEATSAAGYKSYEVSNYAVEGQDSRHNCIYWNAGDYMGIGPGAHGRLTLAGSRIATETVLSPTLWLTAVEQGKTVEQRNIVPAKDQGIEYLMMGLRRDTGIDLDRYTKLAHSPLPEDKVFSLQNLGMLERQENRLVATLQGRMLLNSLIKELID
jgi:putative oxygen-independent coproporphyrinogen III oxidase